MLWKLLNSQLLTNKEEILKILLLNRHLKTKKEVDTYFNPPSPEKISLKELGIKLSEIKKALRRIKQAIKSKEPIIVYGDYDADGICGTAILWEVLYKLGANVLPYIPSRTEEGYGLSEKGINNITKNLGQRTKNSKPLIITVDHGIVANKQVEYAKKKGIDVIITDHHVPPKKLPRAYSIIHTTDLSGSGVAWIFAREIINSYHSEFAKGERRIPLRSFASLRMTLNPTDYLDLIAIGSIADMVPLTGINRILVKSGLQKLNQTTRIGLLELIKDAGLTLGNLGNYEVGYILAPRLNAMGRLEHALDSLRLLCTNKQARANELAKNLGLKNKERQELTKMTTKHAKESSKSLVLSSKLLFVADESYNQGVIGLVAGKLVEEFYRPTIVVSQGKEISKASARSINGFNIIEAIRKCSQLLIDCGGHPMAAGFTIETKYLRELKRKLEQIVNKLLPEERLERVLKIDCEIKLSDLSFSFYDSIQKMQPFGIGNPEPIFLTKNLRIIDLKLVGREQKHLKLRLDDSKTKRKENTTGIVSPAPQLLITNYSITNLDGIGFNLAHVAKNLKVGNIVDVVYTLSINEWNGNERLELKVKDLKRVN